MQRHHHVLGSERHDHFERRLMRSFSELAGIDLHWDFDGSPVIPTRGNRHYVLFRGAEPVVTAQSKWEKLVYFEVALEVGEGTYFVHMDLAATPLKAVVWKAGTSFSAAGFVLTAWSSAAFAGTITTASGRTLKWQPKTLLGLPTITGLLVAPDGSILLSIVPRSGSATSGKMLISPGLAADTECAALIALAFALCNEQALSLHLAPGLAGNEHHEQHLRYRLRAPRADDAVGATGAVTAGKLGYFLLALFLSTFVVWIFSTTLEVIDIIVVMVIFMSLSVWNKVRS
jgi:hypothetical protein